MRLYSVLVISVLTGALAACDRGADAATKPPGGDEAVSGLVTQKAARVSGGDPLPAGAAALPHLRPGYWAVVTTTDGVTVNSTMCLDEAIQNRMSVFGAAVTSGMAGGMCTPAAIASHAGGRWTSHSTCDLGIGAMAVDAVITGDMSTRYRHEQTITTVVAEETETSIRLEEGRFQSACPAGMGPGDILMEGVLPMNMDQLAAAMSPGGGN